MENNRDEPLFESFMKEFTVQWGNRDVKLDTDAFTMWSVCSAIQLACRHPVFDGPVRHHAELFARKVFDIIATTPALKEVAEKGWDSYYDHLPSNDL